MTFFGERGGVDNTKDYLIIIIILLILLINGMAIYIIRKAHESPYKVLRTEIYIKD